MKERKPLRVSYLVRNKYPYIHVWKGQATTKLSAYRQYVKENRCSRYPTALELSKDLDLEQYDTVVKMVRGRWTPVYQ